MSKPRNYIITVSHPTGFHDGDYAVTVKDSDNKGSGLRYVNGSPFGCSRDYKTRNDSDRQAVEMFMAEHACKLVAIREDDGSAVLPLRVARFG